MPQRRQFNPQLITQVREERWDQVQPQLPHLRPADIADLIKLTPDDLQKRLFSLVPHDIRPDVVAELDMSGTEFLKSLSDIEISDIVEDMAPDDAADVLSDFPEDRSEQVLKLMETDDSQEVRELLKYEDDTAGGIMTTDVVAMHEDQSVEEAIRTIAYMDTHEPFLYAHTIDAQRHLTGYIDIWELLREKDKRRKLGEIAHKDFISVTTDMDQEHVAELVRKYDLTVLPVVDHHGVLVGRITADDVLDVIDEEASEDIFRLAGSDDAELENLPLLKSCALRLPWLMITLSGGFVTSYILKKFLHTELRDVLLLAAFVPVVLAMGGNTGIQSSTLVVRSIALGNLKSHNVFHFLLREIEVGAAMGLLCGLVIGIGASVIIATNPNHIPSLPVFYLAMIIGLALFIAMTFAAMFGALVPIILSKMRTDPAVASGPFITIANDILALIIFFAVALLFISPSGI